MLLKKLVKTYPKKCHISAMIDSGAFSAWSKGVDINLKAYAKFLLKNQGAYTVAVNLDVIPGNRGSGAPSSSDVEAAAKQSWQNMKTLEGMGVKVLPVYHFGERRYWLDKMLGEGYAYIGLGAVANKPEEIRMPWLDEVFHYLCRPYGYPCVRVHGFGLTALPIIFRYPWYSVDSISWLLKGAMGKILLPLRIDGQWDYRRTRDIGLGISAIHDDNYQLAGERVQRLVDRLLKEEGINFEEAVVEQLPRIQWNLRCFARAVNEFKLRPFTIKTGNLFDVSKPPHPGSAFNFKHMIFYAGGGRPGETRDALATLEQYRHRLYSYFDLQKDPKLDFAGFVKTGQPV